MVKAGEAAERKVPWGRLLIAGGTDFALLGRKDKQLKTFVTPDRPELPSAHIVRPVCNVKFTRVITSHSGCHAVAIDIDQRAWLFGRNEHHQLTYPLPADVTTPHVGTDGVKLSPTPAAGFPFLLNLLPDSNAPPELKEQAIVEAACGRGHTILITEKGEAWAAGWNSVGQCGKADTEHVSSFRRVEGALAKEKVIMASAGINFTIFLTEKGRVYAVGSGEKGQLGTGKTGEHVAASRTFFTEQSDPVIVRGAIEGKKIVQITSGQQHSVALNDEGYAYAWGFAGLGRLGIGGQVDALLPQIIPQFATPKPLLRCTKISAGSTNTLFIDGQGLVYLCGKWKVSGDGSAGQPWMTPKYVSEIMGYKWKLIAAGGVTLFTYTDDDNGFTVGWGQNAVSGELALGQGAAKSATKPTKLESFEHVAVLDIAAGQNTTFFIVRPPPAGADATPEETEEEVKSPAEEEVKAPVTASTSFVDLSGWGFNDFAPAPGPLRAKSPPPASPSKNKKKKTAAYVAPSTTSEDQWEAFPRYPHILDTTEACVVCGLEEKAGDETLECEMCEKAYHLGCLEPPLTEVPEGEWFCSNCDRINGDPEEERESSVELPPLTTAAGKKRKDPPGGSPAKGGKAAAGAKKKAAAPAPAARATKKRKT